MFFWFIWKNALKRNAIDLMNNPSKLRSKLQKNNPASTGLPLNLAKLHKKYYRRGGAIGQRIDSTKLTKWRICSEKWYNKANYSTAQWVR